MPSAEMPGLRVASDREHELELRQLANSFSCQSGAHSRRGGRSAALLILPRKAKSHRHDGDAALVVELLRVTPSQSRKRSPERSVKGVPEACTRVPGAWLQMASRAVGAHPQHGARLMRQRLAVRSLDAIPARANGGEQTVELGFARLPRAS